MEQLLGVIFKLIKFYQIGQSDLILQDLFETILEHGTFKMVEELYEFLNLCKINGSAALDNIFFNAIRKHNEILDLMHVNKIQSPPDDLVRLVKKPNKNVEML